MKPQPITHCSSSTKTMTDLPSLGGTLLQRETESLPSGFDYAAWATITHHLNTQDGDRWLAGFRTAESGAAFHAVGESAEVRCYFKNMSSGVETPDWHFAITRHARGKGRIAVPISQLDSLTLCNSMRRAICSAAAAFFDLGFELWAKQDLAELREEETDQTTTKAPASSPVPSAPAQKQQLAPKPVKRQAAADPVLTDGEQPLKETDRTQLLASVGALAPEQRETLRAYLIKAGLKIPAAGPWGDDITTAAHCWHIRQFLKELK